MQSLAAILGPQGILLGADVRARNESWRSKRPTEAVAVLRPSSTEEVSRVLALCHDAGQPIVTNGGLTGLVDGCIAAPGEMILSTERLNRIESIDGANRSMTVQAGVPLQRVQEAASEAGLFFALDLGARGSCTIGGNIATNAGGNRVIRYGMARDMVLGIEAVLADGTVMTAMNRMLKNNAGYDLKQLFIGTEGTLGIVTRAVLRLREAPRSNQTALVSCESLSAVIGLLRRCDAGLGGAMSSFEVMWNDFYRLVTTPPAVNRPLLDPTHPYYVIVEAQGSDIARDQQRFEELLADVLGDALVSDALIAGSEAQRAGIWALREGVSGTIGAGKSITFDVSLALSDMESYVSEVHRNLARDLPAWRCLTLGHLGDGNLHFIVTQGGDVEKARHAIESCVYEPLRARGGSVSGEHGIGTEKMSWLSVSRSPVEIALMRQLKQALDPRQILNRGRVLP